jgi:hypothetical protein
MAPDLVAHAAARSYSVWLEAAGHLALQRLDDDLLATLEEQLDLLDVAR